MESAEDLLDKATMIAPSISEWMYIAISALYEMVKRVRENSETPTFYELCYPGTTIPLFTKDQAYELEDVIRQFLETEEQLEQEETEKEDEKPTQHGGGLIPPEWEHAAKTIGKVMETGIELMDGDTFSPDEWEKKWEIKFDEFIRETLPNLAKTIKELSETSGLTLIETTFSDIHGVIPVPLPVPPFTLPIPYQIPAKMILPLLKTFLDVIRFTISTVPFVGTLSSLPPTLLLSLIELGHGELYKSIMTLFGLIGTNGIFLGILAKMGTSLAILLQPALSQITPEMQRAGYKAAKTMLVGFLLQWFTTIAPDYIRLPITTFFKGIKQAMRLYNKTAESIAATVATSTNDKVHLEYVELDPSKVPSLFEDFTSVQRFLQDPAFLAYPGVIDFIEEFRTTPPFAIIVDILNIPRKAELAGVPPSSISLPLKLQVKGSDGTYKDIDEFRKEGENMFHNLQEMAKNPIAAAGAAGLPTSLQGLAGSAGIPTSVAGLAGSAGLPTSLQGLAGSAGLPTSVAGLAGSAGLPTSLQGLAGSAGLPTSLQGLAGSAGIPTSVAGLAGAAGLPTSVQGLVGAAGLPTSVAGLAGSAGLPTSMQGLAGSAGVSPATLSVAKKVGKIGTTLKKAATAGGGRRRTYKHLRNRR